MPSHDNLISIANLPPSAPSAPPINEPTSALPPLEPIIDVAVEGTASCDINECAMLEVETSYTANHALLPAPERYHEVRKRAHSANWIRRQAEHIMKLRRVGNNGVGVFRLVERGAAVNVLKTFWVHARKLRAHKTDGMPEDSARVVAGGYGQVHGVDYDETYCPIMPQESHKINEAEAINDPSVLREEIDLS